MATDEPRKELIPVWDGYSVSPSQYCAAHKSTCSLPSPNVNRQFFWSRAPSAMLDVYGSATTTAPVI